MSSAPGGVGTPARAAGRWPGRPLLAARLRALLRREFGATDAWIVHAPGRVRLEARWGGRTVVVHEGDDEEFWAPFYTTAVRNRYERGVVVAALAPTQRRNRDLVAVLRPWCARARASN